MAIGTSGGVGRLGALFACGALGGKTDAELLGLFADGEAAGAAFEALVVRHGPDVLRACRRLLADPNDAEDAFQATFLVLARRAASGSIDGSESLGPWLHGVALRVARKARVAAARRHKHEARVAGRLDAAVSRSSDDLATAIREEVERLPEPLRLPVVLCYLEDMTYRGAAHRLRVSEGTIRGRLVKARSLLRSRLGRREDLPTPARPPRVPPALLAMTIRGASAFAPGGAGLGSLPGALVELMEGVLTMTLVTRWILGTFAVVAIGLASGGGASPGARGDDEPPGAAPTATKRGPRPAPVRAAEPDPAPVLTLDEAIQQLLRNHLSERAKWPGIPMARADLLLSTAGLCGEPLLNLPQSARYDINDPYPLDISLKRSAHRSGAKTIAEAQYLDSVRMRVDALYSAYVDVQEMHELIRLQERWSTALSRLATMNLRGREGSRAEYDTNGFLSGLIRSGPFGHRQGDRARVVRLSLLKLIDPDLVSDRIRVEPLLPAASIPPAEELVRLAEAARPDLIAYRLGQQRATRDLEQTTKRGVPSTAVSQLVQPYRIEGRPEIARAAIGVRQAEIQRRSIEEAIRQEIQQRHRECESSLAEFKAVASETEQRRRAFREAEGKFEAGTAPIDDAAWALRGLMRLERRQWELLVRHRRGLLALNTAAGVRLFP